MEERRQYTIRELRTARGMSQAELAARLGVNDSTIVGWEKLRSSPRTALSQLAAIFEVESSEIQVKTDPRIGRPRSDATIARLSEASKRRWAERRLAAAS